MNKQLASMIATLLIFPLGAVAAQTAGDDIAEPPSAPASAVSAPAASADAAAKASTDQPIPEAVSDTVTPQPAGAVGEAQSPAATTETDKASTPEKAPEPITGAFGIPLGEHFEPSMVAKVISEQEQTYRGPDGAELKGTLLRVEPSQPDERFQRYSVKTTDKGIVYAIQGDYQYKVKPDEAKPDEAKPKGSGKGAGKPGNKKQANATKSTCKAAVKTMAGELEARYGKPRGRGWDGLWFTFRQFSDTSNRGLKLYGHRCRSGMYSVIYTDDKVQRGTLPGKASTPPEAGTPPTGSVPAKPEPGAESGPQTDAQSTANPTFATQPQIYQFSAIAWF